MSKSAGLGLLVLGSILFAAGGAPAASESGIERDHVWIMVSRDAPERAALTRAGFQIAPEVNRHDGQGTASISVELENGYLELMWPDPTVSVAPGLERAAEKFRQRMQWRTSGWCPFGVGFRRTTATSSSEPLPFPIWTWTAEWMPKGTVMEMLTPRDDTRSPALFIEPRALADPAEQAKRGALYHYSIGSRRLTGIRLTSPGAYEPIAALKYLQEKDLLSVGRGNQWLLELTLDGGATKRSKDLQPDLPSSSDIRGREGVRTDPQLECRKCLAAASYPYPRDPRLTASATRERAWWSHALVSSATSRRETTSCC